MNSFLRVMCCIMILGLSGCQGLKQNMLKAQAVERCNMTCMQHFDFCRQNCINNCPNCSYKTQLATEKNFSKYVHERRVEGKKVMRELNSYRDPLKCRKVTCDCLSDLATCKKGCAGVIPKKLHAVPYCV
ncbi:MAG: acyltransferase [Legionella sp. 39-23]|mgnify:FL=1|nr:MAG: acyltransferase [Legionella sp. 39-23]